MSLENIHLSRRSALKMLPIVGITSALAACGGSESRVVVDSEEQVYQRYLTQLRDASLSVASLKGYDVFFDSKRGRGEILEDGTFVPTPTSESPDFFTTVVSPSRRGAFARRYSPFSLVDNNQHFPYAEFDMQYSSLYDVEGKPVITLNPELGHHAWIGSKIGGDIHRLFHHLNNNADPYGVEQGALELEAQLLDHAMDGKFLLKIDALANQLVEDGIFADDHLEGLSENQFVYLDSLFHADNFQMSQQERSFREAHMLVFLNFSIFDIRDGRDGFSPQQGYAIKSQYLRSLMEGPAARG